jgi:hypothetical protein
MRRGPGDKPRAAYYSAVFFPSPLHTRLKGNLWQAGQTQRTRTPRLRPRKRETPNRLPMRFPKGSQAEADLAFLSVALVPLRRPRSGAGQPGPLEVVGSAGGCQVFERSLNRAAVEAVIVHSFIRTRGGRVVTSVAIAGLDRFQARSIWKMSALLSFLGGWPARIPLSL